jgi:hypothetical protein
MSVDPESSFLVIPSLSRELRTHASGDPTFPNAHTVLVRTVPMRGECSEIPFGCAQGMPSTSSVVCPVLFVIPSLSRDLEEVRRLVLSLSNGPTKRLFNAGLDRLRAIFERFLSLRGVYPERSDGPSGRNDI